MAAGDYFDSASGNIDTGKAGLLAAIGQYGSQAQSAMKAAQDQIAAQKQAALQQALAGAQQRQAPQAELDQITSTISQPYDQRLSDLAQSAASRQASSDALSSGVGSYFDEAKAAVPALRTQLAQKVATLQAQASNQLAAAQARAEQAQLSHDLAMARLEAQQAKAAQPPTIGKIISSMGGPAEAGAQLAPQLADATDAANRQAFIGQPEDQFNPAERVGSGVGLPPDVVANLSRQYDAAIGKQDTKAGDDAAYAKGSSFATQAAGRADASYTQQQFANDVYAIPGMTPAAAAKILGQYGHLFPNSANPGYIPPTTKVGKAG